MKKIALIGANGQLGTDIRKVFETDSYYSIIPLTHADIEITSKDNVQKVLEEIKPDMVINTSAYHRVDEIEDSPEKAFLVNATAQQYVAELCVKNNWTQVFFSTDYVFGKDEKRDTPYKELDIPGPINKYGLSKLKGEEFVKSINPKHFIIRVCGLFGITGSSGKGGNFVELMIKLGKEKGEVQVVNDQICTPTYTTNVAENLKELLKTESYGLYHMTSLGHCSWYEFANEIFSLLKMKVQNTPVDSNFYKTKAKRPLYSVLEKYNLNTINLNKMKDWKENLQQYLKEKKYL